MENKEKIERLKHVKERISYYRKERAKDIGGNIFKTLFMFLPTIVPTTIIVSAIAISGDLPFRRDYKDEYARTKTYYSSITDELRQEKQYKKYENDKDILSYYGPWELQEDGTYERKVKNYKLKNVTANDVQELMKKENTSFEDVFALTLDELNETTYKTNELNQEKLDEGPYFEITVYDKDKQDKIKVKESNGDVISESAMVIIYTILMTAFQGMLIYENGFDYEEIGHYAYKICSLKHEKKKLQEELKVKVKK